MAKKRTRKQKIKTKKKLQQPAVVLESRKIGKSDKSEVTVLPEKNNWSDFFGYDIKLIKMDLIRTLVVTALVLGVLIAILVYT